MFYYVFPPQWAAKYRPKAILYQTFLDYVPKINLFSSYDDLAQLSVLADATQHTVYFPLAITEIVDVANLDLSSHSFTLPPGILGCDSEAASHTLDPAHSP